MTSLIHGSCVLSPWLPMIIVVTMLPVTMANHSDCPRPESKIVRRIINKEILPLYQQHKAAIPHQCLLAPPRDVYGYQEDMKYEESPTKWVCQICGKSFYEERFINKHFDNRHPNSIRETGSVVCLADYCDVFRCEVISHAITGVSNYWDHALCKESDLKRRQQQCIDLIQPCVPEDVSSEIQKIILDHLNTTLCSYLTCDNYWELLSSEVSPLSLVYYIIAGMILLVGLFTYFLLLRSQLSLETPSLLRGEEDEKDNGATLVYAPENQEIRHRQALSVT